MNREASVGIDEYRNLEIVANDCQIYTNRASTTHDSTHLAKDFLLN